MSEKLRKKKKRRQEQPTACELTEEEIAEIEKAALHDFSLDDVLPMMVATKLPEFLDLRDSQLSIAMMAGMERTLMDNMVAFFLTNMGVRFDQKKMWGPPKWQYSPKDISDSFDFYRQGGCPNCGAEFELEFLHGASYNPPALVCFECGHRACPLHFENESDSLVDRLEGRHLVDGDPMLDQLSEGRRRTVFNSGPLPPTKHKASGAVYLRGMREQIDFGQTSKDWWQNYYLPKDMRMQDLQSTMRVLSMISSFKAPTVTEICDVCGNNKAFFHTFQARSADEGATIMYECTTCHARKVFNN